MCISFHHLIKILFIINNRFKTGDMAKMDKSGYVYYKNRQKEVITIGKYILIFCIVGN